MASNPDNPNQANPSPGIQSQADPSLEVWAQGNPVPVTQNQGGHDIGARVSVIEAQMAEMLRILQSLKGGNEGPSVGNPVVSAVQPPPPTELGVSSQLNTPGTSQQDVQWPPYGLPQGYTPPIAENNPGGTPSGVVGQEQPVRTDEVARDTPIWPPNPVVIPQRTPLGLTPQFAVNPQAQVANPGNPVPQAPQVNPVVAPATYSPYAAFGIPPAVTAENPQARDKIQVLEDRLKAIEGSGTRVKNAYDLCLVPNVVIPSKFKVPDFDKYRGTTCPVSHVTMYCRKMAAFAHDDKLLIHYFQDSLAGAPLNWYMQLESARIHCWQDLAEAFVKQYQYNVDLAPDRTQLQGLSKRDNESFREYAQRWRGLAAQVAPPLSEKEMVFMFMETLPSLYYDRLVGSASSSFSDMVVIGERIESGMRRGKIAGSSTGPPSQKKFPSGFPKKKEGETNAITGSGQPAYKNPPQTIPFPSQTLPPQPYQANHNYRAQNYPERRQRVFDPIPMSYTDLFNYLATNNLITTRSMKPIQPPYPRSHNPNVTCGFHEGAVGHTVEDCKTFKHVVQDLIDSKGITFKQEGPNVATNPLPGHNRPAANAIEDFADCSLIRSVGSVQTPLEIIHAELCYHRVIEEGCTQKDVCGNPCCIGACKGFETVLQDLFDRHIVQMCTQEKEEDVLTLQSSGGQNSNARRPIEVPYSLNSRTTVVRAEPIVVPIPAPFPYKSDKAVPWNYSIQTQAEGSQNAPDITNVSGSSGITRSGRVYIPEVLKGGPSKEDEERIRKGKGIMQEPAEAKKVSDQEVSEFLKIMKQSEYKVVDQLNHTPSKISMLSLLLSSEAHRTALMKVLNEAHVTQDITVGQFDGIVGNIVAANYLTFTDDELPPEGRGHNQALHISVKCGEYALARVLIDNGSSLNVLPKSTMNRLDVDCSYLKPSSMVVRAFDGSRREVLGEIEMPLQIGPEIFYVVFQVMDITPSYSCLLGRPWIHSAGAVPSSLHQRLKFVVDNKLIVVSGEEEVLVNRSPLNRYVEAAEESLETSFQALEIANASFVGEGAPPLKPSLSKAAVMVAKVMLGRGYQVGHGLGKAEQGILTPIVLYENKDGRGLGYCPTRADKRRIAEEKRERRLAKLKGRELDWKRAFICDVRQNFRSGGVLNPDQIAALEDDLNVEDDVISLVRRCPAGEELKNWKSFDFPVVFSSE